MCSEITKGKLIKLRRLLGRGDKTAIIVQSAKETITKSDLHRRLVRRLRDTDEETEHYLHDRIMNAFFNQTAIKGIAQGHTVLCLQLTDLLNMTQRPSEKWAQLLRKRLKQVDLHTIDTILIPVNIRNKHWVLVTADMRKHTLALYDSLPTFLEKYTDENPLQSIKKFLQTHPDFKDFPWTTQETQHYPKQKNGVDCGLFTCAAALCIIARQEMHFDHRHIKHFRTQLAQWLIDDSTNHSHVSYIPKTAEIALQNAVPSQSDTHQTHQTTPAHMVIEKKRGGEEGADRDDVEGKRAGNLGSDPGMPQREEQRGCDPHAAHSPSAPQGVAHQDQVKTLSPSQKAATLVLPQRSTPKTSRSKQPRQTRQRGRKPAPTTRNPQANKTQHQLTDFWNNPQPLARMPRKSAATTEQLLSTTVARKATRDEDAPT